MDIPSIQTALKGCGLDGWLLTDFHGRNSVAVEFLGLTGIVTRRSFCFIPVEGEPTILVAPIERDKFSRVPGRVIPFNGYRDLEAQLGKLLAGRKRVAMEYSPNGRLPYIGLVDAGTIELVRSLGVEITSSADLVASFQARLNAAQIASHRQAARNLLETKDATFRYIGQSVTQHRPLTEYDVVQFMLGRFEHHGMITEFSPNCSVDANAGNAHYEPSPTSSATIARGQLVLIDLWAKLKAPGSIYGDITWMAFAGSAAEIPARYRDVFRILTQARDAAVAHLTTNFGRRPLYGADADDACRKVIVEAGFGECFTHRTGHSITTTEHGTGPNIDNLETEDRRVLQPGHLFSIEPGIYTEAYGLRTEINVLITDNGPEVTTLPLQYEITPLL